MESKIENFEKNENPSQDEFADYEEAKTELEKIYDHITDGIILWSKAQWYEEGEKACNYFLTSEKKQKSENLQTKIKLRIKQSDRRSSKHYVGNKNILK